MSDDNISPIKWVEDQPPEKQSYLFCDWEISKAIYGINGIAKTLSSELGADGHEEYSGLALAMECLSDRLYRTLGTAPIKLDEEIQEMVKIYYSEKAKGAQVQD